MYLLLAAYLAAHWLSGKSATNN